MNAGTDGSPAGFVGGSDTILVVEDDPEVRVYVTGVLRGFGYNVIAVGDGPAVLSVLPTIESLDLLFTDVVLPHGMDGKQVSAASLPLTFPLCKPKQPPRRPSSWAPR
jgi:hypothetical protein